VQVCDWVLSEFSVLVYPTCNRHLRGHAELLQRLDQRQTEAPPKPWRHRL
jgi:hypothetical protein